MYQAGGSRNGNGNGAVGNPSGDERFVRLKKEIHKQVVTGLHIPPNGVVDDYELRRELRRGVEQLCAGSGRADEPGRARSAHQ